jgi:hypothetical protein
MNNEKGLTLTELLASITITVFVLGTASLLLFSGLQLFNSSIAEFQDDQDVQTTIQQWSNVLSASSGVLYISGNKELRVDNGNELYSFILSGQEFKQFRFSNDGDASNDVTDFNNTGLSIGSNPGKYSNENQLSARVQSVSYYKGSSNELIQGSTVYGSGALVRGVFTFASVARVDVSGKEHTSSVKREVQVKLLNDWTSK